LQIQPSLEGRRASVLGLPAKAAQVLSGDRKPTIPKHGVVVRA